jgi:hypothetical protein
MAKVWVAGSHFALVVVCHPNIEVPAQMPTVLSHEVDTETTAFRFFHPCLLPSPGAKRLLADSKLPSHFRRLRSSFGSP